jgi:hypothetical protein
VVRQTDVASTVHLIPRRPAHSEALLYLQAWEAELLDLAQVWSVYSMKVATAQNRQLTLEDLEDRGTPRINTFPKDCHILPYDCDCYVWQIGHSTSCSNIISSSSSGHFNGPTASYGNSTAILWISLLLLAALRVVLLSILPSRKPTTLLLGKVCSGRKHLDLRILCDTRGYRTLSALVLTRTPIVSSLSGQSLPC